MKFKKDDNETFCPFCKKWVLKNREGKIVYHLAKERIYRNYKWTESELKTCQGSGKSA